MEEWEKNRAKNNKRLKKSQLKSLGAIQRLDSEKTSHHPVLAIESQLYIENKEIYKRELIHEKLIDLYAHQELKPFFYLAGLAALGCHKSALNNELKKKNLKVFVVPIDSTGDKIFRGYYSLHHSVFLNDKNPTGILCSMLHEIMHFEINEIFENEAKPYPKLSGRTEATNLMINATKTRIERLPQKTKKELRLRSTLEVVFTPVYTNRSSSEDNQAAELAVKVIEICAILGHQQGPAWLKKHVPELWNFHVNIINPAIKAYLEEQNYSLYIDRKIKLKNKKGPYRSSFFFSKNEVNPEDGANVNTKIFAICCTLLSGAVNLPFAVGNRLIGMTINVLFCATNCMRSKRNAAQFEAIEDDPNKLISRPLNKP